MNGALQALTPREASIFACVADTVVAPEPALPPVTATTTVPFFDDWLARAPKLNSLGLRALLYAAELSPRAVGFRRRLRALAPAERAAALERLEGATHPHLAALVKLMRGMAVLAYYGDDGVLRRLGYDPDAVLARARALREQEGRP
jgi:hypothetical protein